MLQTLFSHDPDSIAVSAPSQQSLTFAGLNRQIAYTVDTLNQLGIGRNDRVALVTPNHATAATSFISVASGFTSAPLSSNFTAEQFKFFLGDLKPKALILPEGMESPALQEAANLKIPVIRLKPDATIAGQFTLEAEDASKMTAGFAPHGGYSNPGDIALVLHTSGTTGTPKIVPLSATNLMVSARNIAESLSLGPNDRSLAIAPQFHIHGLMASILAPLSAGGSAFCPPTYFSASQFFNWTEEARPTWYTCVPTMHEIILKQAGLPENAGSVTHFKENLRFIRSCSSSLAPVVLEQLETTFDTVVTEAYGMTEAAHQMSCNPLDRSKRTPGTVGVATGATKIAIINWEAGEPLPPGEIGNICIRGENVTAGYTNEEATHKCFKGGWFNTGDLGIMRADGFLTIAGREKEMFNHGGEKIAPLTVDRALVEFSGVAAALSFAVPDQCFKEPNPNRPELYNPNRVNYGDNIGAALVLRPDWVFDANQLHEFLAAKLSKPERPEVFVVVSKLRTGRTGKPERLGYYGELRQENLI